MPEYTQLLSEEDKIKIKFTTQKGKVVSFVVQYHAKINGRWRSIMRADNCHGSAHQHVYHLHTKEYKVLLAKSNSAAFNEAKRHILKNFFKIKENFLNN
jgi:hypothetical protein